MEKLFNELKLFIQEVVVDVVVLLVLLLVFDVVVVGMEDEDDEIKDLFVGVVLSECAVVFDGSNLEPWLLLLPTIMDD